MEFDLLAVDGDRTEPIARVSGGGQLHPSANPSLNAGWMDAIGVVVYEAREWQRQQDENEARIRR